jgi:hypothetical protein
MTPLPPLPASAIVAPTNASLPVIAGAVLTRIATSTAVESLHPLMRPARFDPDH